MGILYWACTKLTSLPYPGGVMDQPFKVLEMLMGYDNAIDEYVAEKMRKERTKNARR